MRESFNKTQTYDSQRSMADVCRAFWYIVQLVMRLVPFASLSHYYTYMLRVLIVVEDDSHIFTEWQKTNLG